MATLKSDMPWRALKPDAQAFDEVRIVTVPRYKESGLSGDEWRISASIQFFRNGIMVHEDAHIARNVERACSFAAYYHAKAMDDGRGYFAGEDPFCDQEGCANHATVTYRLRRKFCENATPHELMHETIRRFCDRHAQRGNCGLEDADVNYERLSAPPAKPQPEE